MAAAFGPAPEYLTVRIPECEASFHRERQMERWRLAALGAGVVVPLGGVIAVGMLQLLWLALGVSCFVVAGALTWALWRQSTTVSIDVTRRSVTLANVHPAFAEAVSHQPIVLRR